MPHCVICKKEIKTNRGMSIHLARTHNIPGVHGRNSLIATTKFFPFVKKKRWSKEKN